MIDGLALQAACTASAYAAVAAYSAYSGSLAPLGLYVGSSALWLSPLNPNWVWTCPHLCDPAEREAQPTVSIRSLCISSHLLASPRITLRLNR
jgi:hypothetical protein